MGVLAAIFADAGWIGLDVAGVVRGVIERRREQLHQAVAAADQLCVDGRHRAHRALGLRRAARSPPRIEQWNRSGIHRWRPIPRACRHRSSRADTSRRPRLPARWPVAGRTHVCATRRPWRTRRGARRSARTAATRRAGTSRAKRFRRGPAAPTRFMPSFQSPVPNSGRPCEPIARLESSARTQCSNSEPAVADSGAEKALVAIGGQGTARQERHLLIQHGKILRDFQIVGDARRAARCGRRTRGFSLPDRTSAATNAERLPPRTGAPAARRMCSRAIVGLETTSAMTSCS